jgi:hypothetical protein
MPVVCGYSLKMQSIAGLMHVPAQAGLIEAEGHLSRAISC